jgi:hypothetical protein
LSIGEKTLSQKRPGTGRVTMLRTVKNQNGEIVVESEWTTLMKCRPEAALAPVLPSLIRTSASTIWRS